MLETRYVGNSLEPWDKNICHTLVSLGEVNFGLIYYGHLLLGADPHTPPQSSQLALCMWNVDL